ncbi:hypothetical protein GOP47_0006497 [Adiantum capillus-veneris]|uniref:C17orf113 probable zinc finger domain-containing protein n=1 Tax=Adiantum capillus-veneris TaxID=13818 RepID=A0A9D4V2Z9_ADICA|nr:hypothetical protein GOP47_0006497 [Adiantum capillus-veneris]
MAQRTLWAMPRFTTEQPPSKKTKKRRHTKDGSSIEEVQEVQVQESTNLVGSDNKDSESQKAIRRLAWNSAWVGGNGAFEWAEFEPLSARIFCKYCRQVKNSRSEFGKNGSINMQHSALTKHAGTRAHQDAHYMFGKSKMTIDDGVQKRADVAMVSTKRLFAAAYHVAKEDLAFSKFTSTLDLLEICECPYLMRDLYQNDKSCSSFVCYISEDLLRKIVQRLKASNFYSITIDESTDVSLDQHMIVYASFIEDSEPVTVFLGLMEVEEGTAHHLYERASFFFAEMQLDRDKMVCIGTDGASAMTGCLNGVTTRFKRENLFMTSIHCIAHRASLCLVDAIKGSEYAQSIDHIVNEIASTFSKSAIKSAKLKELETEFGCIVLQMSRIHKVRWLSRSSCVHKV